MLSKVPLMKYLGTDSANGGIELQLKFQSQEVLLPAWLYVLWCEPGYPMFRMRKARKREILLLAWLYVL